MQVLMSDGETVVIGGLIVSMFLSMAALPIMLLWVTEKKAEHDLFID